MTPVAEAQALSVRVGDKTLLDTIALSVGAGETVAFIGPNGAGKSTLFRVLSGELAPSAGAVRLKGRDPRACPPRELALHRAVLSQSVSVAFPFTVTEVVRMGAGEKRSAAVATLVDQALSEVGLDDFRHRIIGTLSGGEQQRAHLARVLVQVAGGEAEHGPGVLFLDEPTASLDLRHQIDIVATVRRYASRGTTILVILHDLNLAAISADRVVVLDRGRIAGDGIPRDVITESMLARVFGVTSAVGRVPPPNTPFVLPHAARKQSNG